MHTAATVLVVLVALAHVWFMVLESFLWTTPLGAKLLQRPPAEMAATAIMAKNQGLYNLFLAAGLLWSVSGVHCADPVALQVFFLGCVVVAGIVGALTASWKIILLQATPGALALAVVLAAR